MADIRVNDIFQELIEENLKITECLNVLIKFKTFVDLVFIKLKNNLESNVSEMFEDLHKEVEDVFKQNKKDFSVHKNTKQTKQQLIETLSPNPQTTHENGLNLSSDQSIDTKKVGTNVLKSRLFIKKKTLSSNRRLNQRVKKEMIIDENQRYVCDFIGCGQRLKNKESLRSHRRLHSDNAKPFHCNLEGCSYTTGHSNELKDHMNAHNGIYNFNCQFCDKRFTAQRYLTQHTKIIHEIADQILICGLEDCRKEFTTELSLKRHQLHCHLKEKRFACEEPNCAFKTTIPSALKQHFTSVHSPLRPFRCSFEGCPKAFKLNSELNRHLESHTSERNFKCAVDGCGKAFKTSKNLKTHTYTRHSGIKACDWPGCDYTTTDSTRLREHTAIHSIDRNFLCNWPQCGKRFKRKKDLETHQRIHTNDKRFVCSWPGCQYRCTDSGNFIKHKRVHTKG